MNVSAFSDVVRARVMARSGGFCEIRAVGCWDEASQIHHRRPRGLGGSKNPATGQASNALAVCVVCHSHAESHRSDALDRGWIVRQGHAPAEVPVFRYGRWVLLDDEGGIAPVEVTA